MTPGKKTLITVLLVGGVLSVLFVQTTNPNLFSGFLSNDLDTGDQPSDEATGQPDLQPKLEVIAPELEGDDLQVSATIENTGEAAINGTTPFRYAIFINDIEVFANTDSYSTVEPGDSFNFVYPIPRTIYQYPSEGTIKFVLDTENSIQESSEDNNELTVEYSI